MLVVILHAASGTAQTASGLAAAFNQSFWGAVGFTGVAVALSCLLPGRPATAIAAVATGDAGAQALPASR